MKARLPRLGELGVAFGLGALLVATFSVQSELDYNEQVRPAMNALLEGDIGEFFQVQPVHGLFSVVVRFPFAALARLAGGSDLFGYQLGVLPCVAALAIVALLLVGWMRDRGQGVPAQLLAGGLLMVNPVTVAAIERGHPEELLTAALVLGAAFAAFRSRPGWTAVLLGLAVATKQWALIAALPLLLACRPAVRLRIALVAAVVAAAFIAPMALADTGKFVANNRAVTAQGGWYHASRLSFWWPLGRPQKIESGGVEGRTHTLRRLPEGVAKLTRPLVAFLAVALSFAFWRRHRAGVAEDTLALLALLFLLRCLLDPLNNDYYHIAFLGCLITWESVRMRGLPVLSLLAAAGLWATISSPWLSPLALGDQFYLVNNVFYLGWTLPLTGWLVFKLFSRRRQAAAPDASTIEGAGLARTWIEAPISSAH